MSGVRYVKTAIAKDAVRGREPHIVRAPGISWNGSGKHINCPDPPHPDKNPSWRLLDDGREVCTCRQAHSVFDVIEYVKGLNFDDAKLLAVELIGRSDLIIETAASMNNAPGLTLAEYGEAKRLPIDLLQSLGVRDAKWQQKPAVMFPFNGADGQVSSIYYRIALWAKGRSFPLGKGRQAMLVRR